MFYIIYFRRRNRTDDDQDITITNNVAIAENLLRIQHVTHNASFPLVNLIHCAAHTLQLAVFNVVKKDPMKKNISVCHKLAVAFRKPTIIAKLQDKGLHVPLLDLPTQWNRTYNMIERLLEFKLICIENSVV